MKFASVLVHEIGNSHKDWANKVKSYKFFICLFLTIFTFQSQNALAITTDTEYITPDRYFDTALNEINEAKSSIFLVMYLTVC